MFSPQIQEEGNDAVVHLNDSSVELLYCAFVKTEYYWGYFFDIHVSGKLALVAGGCSIPFPQQDVHYLRNINI